MARIGFSQPLTLQHHPSFREYTIAQSNSELELSDTDADFPEFIAGDHFGSLHQFGSGGLPDTDSDSAEFSDARSQPGEPHSPSGQQLPKGLYFIRSEEPALSLTKAFHHAVQARGYLSQQSAELAAASLVKACSLSTFTLGTFGEQRDEWAKVVQDLESLFSVGTKPLLGWAVKSILMGYGFLPTPSNKYELFNNPTVSTWLTWPGEISHSDVTWVGYVGKFKSHWALLKPSEPPPKSSEDGGGPSLLRDPAVVKALKYDIDQMRTCRPKHPITLQSYSMLQQHLWKDADTQLVEGYTNALWLYTDPAIAMQHVLHCMYIELMDCHGVPDNETKMDLKDAADKVMEMYEKMRNVPFRDEVCLWDVVSDKLIAAMLMLGHSFPLHKVLEGHRMAQFVVEKHTEVREQIVSGKGTGMVVFSVNNPVSAESSFSADAKLTDDDEAPTHRCQRCNRPKKESEMFVCEKCHETWWCSQACQSRDVTMHRNSCKAIKLKKKLKSNRKTHASP
ncbi:TPA: hypothetical protein ACH3X3_011213 [Trebouxia sp. C0006]